MKKESTSPINANIPSTLLNQVIQESKKRQTTKTEILIDALNLYFNQYNPNLRIKSSAFVSFPNLPITSNIFRTSAGQGKKVVIG